MLNNNTESVGLLIKAILNLQTEEECRNFLDDILTINELREISQRLKVAILLSEGNNYQTVCEQTRVSTATITRVNKCLMYGSGGYTTAIERLKAEEKS